MQDYIPRQDSEFNSWQQNFVTVVGANLTAYGLVAADLTPLTTRQPTWTSGLSQNITAQAAANAARQAKDTARDARL